MSMIGLIRLSECLFELV